MITVAEALEALFALSRRMPAEVVPLTAANGRVLLEPVTADRDQPPFPASSMDGYAVTKAAPGDRFQVIGEAAAGARFEGALGAGQAVRIFTGAPVPTGTGRVVIQEEVTRDGDIVTVTDRLGTGNNIRPAGNDFRAGHTLNAPRRLGPNDIALLASMNVPRVTVARRPKVAILSTGDELVMPGDTPGPDQIVASNSFGLQALLSDLGAEARLLPIARDTQASLELGFALCDDADLVLTIGGASVGDYDLVGPVAQSLGMDQSFYKVAMRPGKPLMAGRLKDAMMIGLPGNPVSAMVCGHVFVAPVIAHMLGFPAGPRDRQTGQLAAEIGPNGPREHYMRATRGPGGLQVFDRQDSGLLSVLGAADALVVRPPNDPARPAGDMVEYIPL